MSALRAIKLLKCLCVLFLVCGLSLAAYGASAQMMLPKADNGESDVSGWLMSEKFDGVRGYWDGTRLWSKNGRRFYPPSEFVEGLPGFALEGELWAGRGKFEQTASIVLRQQPHEGWLQLRFAIFDVPEAPGGFTRRMEQVQSWFAVHPDPYAFVIPQIRVRDRPHLQQELQRIEELGGEGLIVRSPDAPYAAGRSTQILKVKEFDDAEAVVVGHILGQGRNAGRLGSLLVELPDGVRFRIGTGFSDAEREDPPPKDAVVTFKYDGFYRSGIPKFPSFLRVRQDQGL